MTIRYPNGKEYKTKNNQKISSANRGMDFERDINLSNTYYKNHNIALISKRPTPVHVVKVDPSQNNKIVEAYFLKEDATDYNGVYKGRYIDFEAKSTQSKTSFPLSNISNSQIEHLKCVIKNNGICFFIIKFNLFNEVYLLEFSKLFDFFQNNDRRSIPYETIKKHGYIINELYEPRLDYLRVVDEFLL